uniref:Uncharacterized protein n=1 Tax=Cannabis sativa TaxID=3483 RepID=A0A803QK62_CANSA
MYKGGRKEKRSKQEGVGHPQAPEIQALNAQALQGIQNAPVVGLVVALGAGNPYPPGVAQSPLDGHVATIFGGPHIAGSTQMHRKEDDAKHVNFPHNDPLVIKAHIVNKRVSRILVDNGISVNIIFKDALAIGLVEANLLPYPIQLLRLQWRHADPNGKNTTSNDNKWRSLWKQCGVLFQLQHPCSS